METVTTQSMTSSSAISLTNVQRQVTGSYEVKNKAVLDFVSQMAQLCEPDRIYFCDGSQTEQG